MDPIKENAQSGNNSNGQDSTKLNNNQQINMNNENNSQASFSNQNDKKSFGPIIGSLIIVLVLIIASILIWGKRTTETMDIYNYEPITDEQTAEEVSVFESDLNIDLDVNVEELENLNF